jgi:phosphatidylserine decarboxylase
VSDRRTDIVTADPPDRASAAWRLGLALIGRLPQGMLSRMTGRLADVPVPRFLRRYLFGAFASIAGIDLAEAGRPLREYRTFDDFFIRQLRPGVRRWPADARGIASPADGTVGQFGTVRDGVLLQAKGRTYTAAALLDDEAEAMRFNGGVFVTLYLSPRDYHRVHSPLAGSVAKVRHVPGALLPVNEQAIRHVAGLFPRNERVACYLDGPAGRVAIVAIGAFNVGRIEVVFDQSWRSNRRGSEARDVSYDPPQVIGRGDELMIFHLGSTVVLLFEAANARLVDGLRTGSRIRLGDRISSAIG